MPFFVRKIELQKWLQNDILNGADVSADAITGCLRTKFNTLSFWYVESDEQISDAVLAITSSFEKADSIDIVTIDTNSFSNGLIFSSTDGLTPYEDFKDKHRDLTELTYPKLGTVAEIIIKCIKENKRINYSRKTIKEMLHNSLNNGKIKREKLSEKLIKDLKL